MLSNDERKEKKKDYFDVKEECAKNSIVSTERLR
jgi:hypothetical protein